MEFMLLLVFQLTDRYVLLYMDVVLNHEMHSFYYMERGMRNTVFLELM